MLDDDDGIAHIAQVFERMDQFIVVARVQADGGFVKNIGDADKSAANLRGKPYSLRFSTGKGRGGSIKGKIMQADFEREIEDAVGSPLRVLRRSAVLVQVEAVIDQEMREHLATVMAVISLMRLPSSSVAAG